MHLFFGLRSVRNPRNLELLRIARKPKGWTLDKSWHEWWYCVDVERTGRAFKARLLQHTGQAVLTVSTGDSCFEKVS